MNIDLIIQSIKSCLKNKNWFAAMFLCLAIPDICSSLEDKNRKTSRKLYIR